MNDGRERLLFEKLPRNLGHTINMIPPLVAQSMAIPLIFIHFLQIFTLNCSAFTFGEVFFSLARSRCVIL